MRRYGKELLWWALVALAVAVVVIASNRNASNPNSPRVKRVGVSTVIDVQEDGE